MHDYLEWNHVSRATAYCPVENGRFEMSGKAGSLSSLKKHSRKTYWFGILLFCVEVTCLPLSSCTNPVEAVPGIPDDPRKHQILQT